MLVVSKFGRTQAQTTRFKDSLILFVLANVLIW